jgi:Fe-S cluster assembly iron-binding protein IscA
MAIEVTDEAIEVLNRSLDLAKVDRAAGGVRLRGARGLGGGFDVQVEMAAGPLEGEKVLEQGGLRLFVDPEVETAMPEAVLAVEPQHEIVVLRPKDPGA